MRHWHAIAALFVLTFGAYLNALGNGRVAFDDAESLSRLVRALHRNLEVARGRAGPALRVPAPAAAFAVSSRALTKASLALDRVAFGGDPWAGHLENIALHFAAACLAFLAAARLLGSLPLGLAAAALFALHPAQTESVAYLAGRRDLLSGALALAATVAWLQAGRRPAWLAAAAVLWGLGLAAKQSTVVLPLAWTCFLALCSRGELRPPGSARARFVIALSLAGAAVAAWQVAFFRQASSALPPQALWLGGSRAATWLTEPGVLLAALKVVAWPVELCADYSPRSIEVARSLDAGVLARVAVLAGLAALAAGLVRRRPVAAFGLIWAAVAYAPMLPLFPTEHNRETFAEHWLYLPLFGFALAAADALGALAGRSPRAARALLAGTLLLYAGRTAARNRDWRDEESLWSKTLAQHPGCVRAAGSLAGVRLRAGRWDEARRLLEAAAEGNEDPRLDLNLAAVYQHERRYGDAAEALERARSRPLYRLVEDLIVHQEGLLCLERGEPWKAEAAWREALGRLPPRSCQARLRSALGTLLLSRGREAEAEPLLARAASCAPEETAALEGLARLRLGQRRFAEAEELLRAASGKDGGNWRLRLPLAFSLARQRRFPEAHAELKRALELAPQATEAWLAYSALNLEWGLAAQARAAAQRAVWLENSPRTFAQLEAALMAAAPRKMR